MRKYYIDNIRWITVFLVVIYHIIYMFNGVEIAGVIGPFQEIQYQDTFLYIVYPWFMVILFIISGISSRYYLENHTEKEFLKSRTRKLLVPSTIGLFVFQWIQGYYNMVLANAFETLPSTLPKPVLFGIMAFSGTGVLWYIQLLWLFSIILLIIRKFEKGKIYEKTKNLNIGIIIALVIPLWGAAQILNTPIVVVYRFGIYGFSFFLGYFIFAHEEVFERLSKYWLIFTILAIVFAGVYVYRNFGKNCCVNPLLKAPESIAYAWCSILAIFAVAKRWWNYSSKFTVWVNKKSYGIYVFHYLGISIVGYYCHKKGISAVPTYVATTIGAFGGALILYELISRIPILRWCVLGIKK